MAKVTSSLPSGISIHNNLSGLNDPEYIHLTTLEKAKLDGIEDGAQVNPTNTSELINDGDDGLSTYVETDELGAVAFSNNYNDLDNLPIVPPSYTDEQAQDAIGNILTDSSTIDLSYDNLTNEISAEIIPGSITSNELANNINISEFINDENYTDEDYVDEKIVQTITDGDTTHTSSSDALFDALALKQNSLGYTPENVANKENTTLDTSTTKYPTNRLVKEYVDAKVPFDIIKNYPNQILIQAVGNAVNYVGTYAQTITGTQSDLLIGGGGVAYRKVLGATTAGSSINFYDASTYRITSTKGFYYRARIKNDDPTNIPTARFSYGLSGTALITNINPSTYTLAMLSFAADNSDTNCQIMYKNALGTATKIDLGSTMPKSRTDEYVIEFWRLEGTATINYKITNLTTSVVIQNSFVFAFTGLALGCFRNNDIATTAVSFAVRRIELYIND